MKILLTIFFSFFTIMVYAADTYKLDPNHTYILWKASHFGFSEQSGKWPAEGTLILDETQPENSKVDVIIPIGKLATGLPEFDKHLKAKLFFDVTRFPTATFVSKKIQKTGDSTAKIEGILTIRGVSKPVVLNVRLNKKGVSPINDKETVGFSGDTTIKRSDFGMTTLIPGVSDDVKLFIEVEAAKPKATA